MYKSNFRHSKPKPHFVSREHSSPKPQPSMAAEYPAGTNLNVSMEETTFDALGLHPNLLKGIQNLGFTRPTPIQANAIPVILKGDDLIGCAQTGTGKTAAFVLPILHKLLQGTPKKNVRALVLAPTRELALQSMDHLKALSKFCHLKGAAIFGGVPMPPQISALRQGVDIISATPGRLLDHIYSGRIDFKDLEVFVLDEVDRMLDMGFLPDIEKILRLLPPERQNLVFSATLANEILLLTRKFLKSPVTIQIGPRRSPAVGIRHAVYIVPQHLKIELLLELLRGQGMTSVLIFSRTKHFADRLAHNLEKHNYRVSTLHGDRSQQQRLRALEQFRRGQNQIMVATDIAARGIDVDGITHVINFDIPNTPEDYIHRIGRTARAEATGDAFTFIDKRDEYLLRDIEKVLGKPLPRVTLPNFNYKKPNTASKDHHQGSDRSHGRPFGRPQENRGASRWQGGGHSKSGGFSRHGSSAKPPYREGKKF